MNARSPLLSTSYYAHAHAAPRTAFCGSVICMHACVRAGPLRTHGVARTHAKRALPVPCRRAHTLAQHSSKHTPHPSTYVRVHPLPHPLLLRTLHPTHTQAHSVSTPGHHRQQPGMLLSHHHHHLPCLSSAAAPAQSLHRLHHFHHRRYPPSVMAHSIATTSLQPSNASSSRGCSSSSSSSSRPPFSYHHHYQQSSSRRTAPAVAAVRRRQGAEEVRGAS